MPRRAARPWPALARTAAWSLGAALALALARRGVTLGDEGVVLSGALAILEGKVPYRDIDMFVAPGVWFLDAALFVLGGVTVFSTRVAAAACMVATMAMVRVIVRHCAGAAWADLAAVLVAVLSVWAWPAWSWSFYSPWAMLCSLSAFAAVLRWMRTRRVAWLAASGVLLGAAVAFKQNYGVFAAAGCFLALVVDEIVAADGGAGGIRAALRRLCFLAAPLAAGGAVVVVPGVLWLAAHGALPAAFDLLVVRPFVGFAGSHSIRYVDFSDLWRQAQVWTANGWIYMSVPLATTVAAGAWARAMVRAVVGLHVLLYWIPPFALAASLLRSATTVRRGATPRERSLAALGLFAACCFLGVFPRCDFNHLVNVLQPVLALLAAAAGAVLGRGRWRSTPFHRALAAAAGLALAAYAGTATLWLDDMRRTAWVPLESPRAGVLLDAPTASLLEGEIDLLHSLAGPGQPVFAIPSLSLVPFLAERPMPTRYSNFHEVHVGHDGALEATRELEQSGARVVLATYDNFFADPGGMLGFGRALAESLRTRFRPEYAIAGLAHMVHVRRDTPLPPVPSRDLLATCDVGEADFPTALIRERLLYWSLFHSFRDAAGSRGEVSTTCRFQVPAGARLRLGVELRQPEAAGAQAGLKAEAVLVAGDDEPVQVVNERWELARELPVVTRPFREVEVDLSRWEGREVRLVLRSTADGPLPPALRDPLGTSIAWNGGRIESPAYAGQPER